MKNENTVHPQKKKVRQQIITNYLLISFMSVV